MVSTLVEPDRAWKTTKEVHKSGVIYRFGVYSYIEIIYMYA